MDLYRAASGIEAFLKRITRFEIRINDIHGCNAGFGTTMSLATSILNAKAVGEPAPTFPLFVP